MRLLSRTCLLVVVAGVLSAGALSTASTASDARPVPEHGVDAGAFYPLWSGDTDGDLPANASGDLATLTRAIDVPFDTPPSTVDEWNTADLADFPRSDWARSIHPPDATLHSEGLIRDAYVEVFAVAPSTRARLAPTETPLLVGRRGRVLATTDYRAVLPAATSTTGWTLTNHSIESVTLRVDGVPVDATHGTHTPVLAFDDLGAENGGRHTLTVTASIRVVAVEHSRQSVTRVLRTTVETQTVTDSVVVQRETLDVTGTRMTYADGTRGVALTSETPWAGFTTASGRAQGAWAFYAARDPAWDTLVTSTAHGETTRPSPLHPLQVNAYPRASGASARGGLELLDVEGATRQTPTLPENVSLATPDDAYTATRTLAVRERAPGQNVTIVAHGLVRGTDVTLDERTLTRIPQRQSRLTLERLASTPTTVTLDLHLTDAATGDPIDTNVVGGVFTLDGERVQTNASGRVVLTLPREDGAFTARYEPTPWWRETTPLGASSDSHYVRDTPVDVLGALYGIGVPVGVLLVAGFIIDRATGWGLWPPWRRL